MIVWTWTAYRTILLTWTILKTFSIFASTVFKAISFADLTLLDAFTLTGMISRLENIQLLPDN